MGIRGDGVKKEEAAVVNIQEMDADMSPSIAVLIRGFFLAFFGILLVLILFFSGKDYFLKINYPLPNVLLLIIGVLLVALLYAFLWRFGPLMARKIRYADWWALLAATLALFLIQITIAVNIAFMTGWDAGTVFDFAWQKVDGQAVEGYGSYFSFYPNNILIAWLYTQVLALYRATLQGLLGAAQLHLLIALNAVISCTTALLVYRCVHMLTGRRIYAWLGWIGFAAVAGLSPWILIPYSDTVGILFSALLLYLYLKPFRRSILKGTLMGICLYIGYRIKPTTVIPFIAIAVVEGIAFLRRPAVLRKVLPILLSMLSAFLVMQLVFMMLIVPSMGIPIRTERALGPLHFLKMGLNPTTDGAYLHDDVLYSQSFSDRESRNAANMEVIRSRLEAYGLGGYLDFLSRKALSVFNAGSFAWAGEGTFYRANFVRPTTLATYLARYYYSYGEWHHVFLAVAQTMWLPVLLFCFMFGFGKSRVDDRLKENSVIRLSLIGIVIYLLLFEARARYIYACLPIFIVGAVLGFRTFMGMVKRITVKLRQSKCVQQSAD